VRPVRLHRSDGGADRAIKATGPGDDTQLAPSYNVAPTNKVYAVLERGHENRAGAVREIHAVRWGWCRPGGTRHRPENREGEDHADPAQRPGRQGGHRAVVAGSVRQAPGGHPRRRLLRVAAHRARGRETGQAAVLHPPPADRLLSFAGLYDLWTDPAKDAGDPDRWLWSMAIITHHATWLAGVMNDRTPVILPADRIDAWLDLELTDKDAIQDLISGIEYEPLQVRPVSTAVNKTGRGASKGPELIEPLRRPRRQQIG
jgi:putative SOS response-associated peptidase YedK